MTWFVCGENYWVTGIADCSAFGLAHRRRIFVVGILGIQE
jgi:hypothetical protein